MAFAFPFEDQGGRAVRFSCDGCGKGGSLTVSSSDYADLIHDKKTISVTSLARASPWKNRALGTATPGYGVVPADARRR